MTFGPEFSAALIAAQAEMPDVKKDSDNPFYKSRYASLAGIIKATRPVLKKHGLGVAQMIGCTSDGGDVLRTIVMHTSGQYLSEAMRLHLVKDDPQGQGSAVTYARRYAYCAALGLVPDEDDDGNAASKPQTVRGHVVKPQTQRRPPPVVQMDPKRQLLAACAGDKDLAARLWAEALEGSKDGINDMEFKLLLSRAQAEVDGAPFNE